MKLYCDLLTLSLDGNVSIYHSEPAMNFFGFDFIFILLTSLQIRNANFCFAINTLNQTSNGTNAVNGTKLQFRLPPNYLKENRPSINGEPTVVYFDVHVQAINPIKAADMDFRFDMTFSQLWVDRRLNFSDEWFVGRDHILLPVELIDQIWHPDPYIVNAKSTDVGQLTQKLVSVYVYKNQTVVYSTNLFATVACAMNYQYYPYDFQLCPMLVESFAYDENQVIYRWSDTDAFTINPKLRMLQFQVTWPLHYEELSVPRYKEANNFTQLIAYFRFDRLLGNHLIQTFSPCSLVVSLSWFSFWLELNALSARMSLLVTAILTLVTQFAGLKTDLPPVAYIKAVDVWMAGCLVWVFGALGEFVLVKIIYSITEDEKFKYAAAASHKEDNIHLQDYENDNDVAQRAGQSGNDGSSGVPGPRPFQLHRFAVPDDVFGSIPSKGKPLTLEKSQVQEEDEDKKSDTTMTSPVNESSTARRRKMVKMFSTGYTSDEAPYDDTNQVTTTVDPIKSSGHLKGRLGRLSLALTWSHEHTGRKVFLWKRIDNLSKVIFPVSFGAFCSVYWSVLYMHSIHNAVKPFTGIHHAHTHTTNHSLKTIL